MAQNILKAAKPKIRCRLGFVFLAGSHAAHYLLPAGLFHKDGECWRWGALDSLGIGFLWLSARGMTGTWQSCRHVRARAMRCCWQQLSWDCCYGQPRRCWLQGGLKLLLVTRWGIKCRADVRSPCAWHNWLCHLCRGFKCGLWIRNG